MMAQRGRNDDADPVHLQVRVGGERYDSAVTALSTQGGESVTLQELDAPPVGAAWQEGWHTSERLDYIRMPGVHSGVFPTMTLAVATLQQHGVSLVKVNSPCIHAWSIATSARRTSPPARCCTAGNPA